MKEKVLELFDAGYNCAQAVVCAYGDTYGLGGEQCFRISASFGGGIGKSARYLCGAVNAGLMLIGLHHAKAFGDKASKDMVNQTARQFLSVLEKQHSSLICRDILRENSESNSMHSNKCRVFLAEVCDALDSLFK